MGVRRRDPENASDDATDHSPRARCLDVGDVLCGELALLLRKELLGMPPGALLEVVARDPAAPQDIPAWCQMTATSYGGPTRPASGSSVARTENSPGSDSPDPRNSTPPKEPPCPDASSFPSHAARTTPTAPPSPSRSRTPPSAATRRRSSSSAATSPPRHRGLRGRRRRARLHSAQGPHDGLREAGGRIYTCLPCFAKRGLDEEALVQGADIVGGPKLVAFMADGAPSVSY